MSAQRCRAVKFQYVELGTDLIKEFSLYVSFRCGIRFHIHCHHFREDSYVC